MPSMRVMGRGGDAAITWDPSKPEEVEAARKMFNELVGLKKFLAFKFTAEGARGEQITVFDPAAQRILIAPPIAGG